MTSAQSGRERGRNRACRHYARDALSLSRVVPCERRTRCKGMSNVAAEINTLHVGGHALTDICHRHRLAPLVRIPRVEYTCPALNVISIQSGSHFPSARPILVSIEISKRISVRERATKRVSRIGAKMSGDFRARITRDRAVRDPSRDRRDVRIHLVRPLLTTGRGRERRRARRAQKLMNIRAV